MPEYFANVKPTTPAGEQRVLDDVMFLSESLERLRGVKAANLEAHFRGRFRLPRCGAVEAESSLSCLLYLSAVLHYSAPQDFVMLGVFFARAFLFGGRLGRLDYYLSAVLYYTALLNSKF